jgi:hypothetical protein
MMEELKNVAVGWLSILVMVQSGVFMLSASDGRPMIKSYFAAWAKTLCATARFFVPGKTSEERKESLVVWAIVALCVPGAILVVDAIGRIAG